MTTSEQPSRRQPNGNRAELQLRLTVAPGQIPFFLQLLGPGFIVKSRTGISLEEFLCRQPGISREYLDDRIKTIFLNGKAVDDLKETPVGKGATIALSAAMPGLVGATMRRGGVLASMRKGISEDQPLSSARGGEGHVILKLFNFILKELGPTFLQVGVWIQGADIADFLHRHFDELKGGGVCAELDTHPIEIDGLKDADWASKLVCLKLHCEEPG